MPSPGLAARAALAVIRGYQVLISPLFAGSCRFVPSCSDYATQAIATHGLMRGTGLAVWRITRCQPFARAGHDPVPPGRSWRNRPARTSDPAI